MLIDCQRLDEWCDRTARKELHNEVRPPDHPRLVDLTATGVSGQTLEVQPKRLDAHTRGNQVFGREIVKSLKLGRQISKRKSYSVIT